MGNCESSFEVESGTLSGKRLGSILNIGLPAAVTGRKSGNCIASGDEGLDKDFFDLIEGFD